MNKLYKKHFFSSAQVTGVGKRQAEATEDSFNSDKEKKTAKNMLWLCKIRTNNWDRTSFLFWLFPPCLYLSCFQYIYRIWLEL